MRKELQDMLAAKYPFMERNPLKNPKVIDDLYGAFGMEFGDGWYQLMDDLCQEIADAFQAEGQEVNIVIDQIKEKYGSLRFYYHFEREPIPIHAFDILGPKGVSGARIMPKGNSLSNKIAEIVSRYESKSKKVCEICGRDGVLRNELPWIRTLCDECFSKLLLYRNQ